MNRLMIGLMVFVSVSAFADCDYTRETSGMTNEVKETIEFLDRIQGTYPLSGKDCGTITIEVENVCHYVGGYSNPDDQKPDCTPSPENNYDCRKTIWGADVSFVLKDSSGKFINGDGFTVQPSGISHRSGDRIKVSKREIYLYSRESSGGGFGTNKTETIIKFNKDEAPTSVSYKHWYWTLEESIQCSVKL